MKKLILVIVVFAAFQFHLSAQVQKDDVEEMLSELGSSVEEITSLYVGNTKDFYTDGTWKRTYSKYQKTNDSYENSFLLKESGILMKTKKDGKLYSMELFPYSEMRYIYIKDTSINIYLKD